MAEGLPGRPEDYLKLQEAAAYLGIHPASLRRLVLQGRGPTVYRLGTATNRAWVWLFNRTELQQFASSYNPVPGRKDWDQGKLSL